MVTVVTDIAPDPGCGRAIPVFFLVQQSFYPLSPRMRFLPLLPLFENNRFARYGGTCLYPRTWSERQANFCVFKAILMYMESSRTARAA